MPDYLTPEYVARVHAFMVSNRIQFVDDDELAGKYFVYTLPYVDPRSLIFAPSVDVEDVFRDGILLKLAGITSPTVEDLQRVHEAYVRAKLSVAEDFVLAFLKEVKR